MTMQLAMTEVEDYNTECISAEKCIITLIAGHQHVPAGPWSGPWVHCLCQPLYLVRHLRNLTSFYQVYGLCHIVRQPNPVFWHNLALESIVVFNVELAFQGH